MDSRRAFKQCGRGGREWREEFDLQNNNNIIVSRMLSRRLAVEM